MIEIWKDIPGFEGRYQVSNMGRVRSVDRVVRAVSKTGREYERKVQGTVLSPGNCRGYQIVNLSQTGTIAVHLLVARAFVAGFTPGLEVNHKDGNKKHNAAANLEWTTRQGNQMHAVSIGLKSQAIPVRNPETGDVFPSIAQAAKGARVSPKTARRWVRV